MAFLTKREKKHLKNLKAKGILKTGTRGGILTALGSRKDAGRIFLNEIKKENPHIYKKLPSKVKNKPDIRTAYPATWKAVARDIKGSKHPMRALVRNI